MLQGYIDRDMATAVEATAIPGRVVRAWHVLGEWAVRRRQSDCRTQMVQSRRSEGALRCDCDAARSRPVDERGRDRDRSARSAHLDDGVLEHEHDLFGKPVSTFPDHALASRTKAHFGCSGSGFFRSVLLRE